MISVCIATYNGEKFIIDQLMSILIQIGINDEVIVSDDHSTDKTVQLIDELKDSRIKVLENTNRMGCSGNFENAILNSKGDFIFLADQDDIWVADKVEKMMNNLRNADLVVSDALFADENMNTTNETYFLIRGGKNGFWTNLYKSRYLGACMAFRRVMLDKLLPFPLNERLCPHDLWITLVAEFYYSVQIVNEPLITYRRHSQNVSTGGLKSNNSFLRKIWFRFYSFFMLINRD